MFYILNTRGHMCYTNTHVLVHESAIIKVM